MRPLFPAITAVVCLVAPAFAQDVQPGSKDLDVGQAPVHFDEVCVDHLPQFDGSEAFMDDLGTYEIAGSGTYFHQEFNLSFKVIREEGMDICSMVFFTSGDNNVANAILDAYAKVMNDDLAETNPNVTIEAQAGSGDNLGFFRIVAYAEKTN